MPILMDKLFNVASINLNNKIVNNTISRLLNAYEYNISFDAIICYFFINIDNLIKDKLNNKLYLQNFCFPNNYIHIIENFNNNEKNIIYDYSQNRIKSEIHKINEINNLINFDINTKELFLEKIKENLQKINTEEFINKLGRC